MSALSVYNFKVGDLLCHKSKKDLIGLIVGKRKEIFEPRHEQGGQDFVETFYVVQWSDWVGIAEISENSIIWAYDLFHVIPGGQNL